MRQLFALLILAVMIYAIVDCAQADARTRRNVPLWVWVALILLLPGFGAAIWLVLSRLVTPPPVARRTRPLAPDDDPEFLRELERRSRQGKTAPDQTPAVEDAPVQDEPVPDAVDDEKHEGGTDRPR